MNTPIGFDNAVQAGRAWQTAAQKIQSLSFDAASELMNLQVQAASRQAESMLTFGREVQAVRDPEAFLGVVAKAPEAAGEHLESALELGRNVTASVAKHVGIAQAYLQEQAGHIATVAGNGFATSPASPEKATAKA